LVQADRDSAALTEPGVVAESRFEVTNARAQTDLVQLVVDFEGKARLLTNFLLPKSATQITVVQESQFGPVITYQAKFPLPSLATETEIVQQVVDLPPEWRAERAYHGFAL
jgi:hypothetical protein